MLIFISKKNLKNALCASFFLEQFSFSIDPYSLTILSWLGPSFLYYGPGSLYKAYVNGIN
jgi:hypothetical protein